MPSVDQRVVELEFDNHDFADRVSESVSALKQLESAIQMGGSAKGINEVSSAIGKMNVNPMLDAAESVSNKFSVMRAVAVSAINRITNGVISAGAKLVGWMPNQVISGGWTRAANVAKAKFTFEGLAKGTGATWEKMSEDINYAVQGTAYTFDAAALAASSFFASGIQQGDQMKQALRAVSGVAAMTSSDYSDIARIFTTVAGNGRLMGEQLNQISARGINAAATLATKLGVTEEEVRDLVSKGKIDFATFAEAMDEAFGEHATEANKTFQGALANIKAALSKLGEKFAAPFMESMIPVLNGIRNMFSNFKDQIDPIVNVWKKVLDTVSPALARFFETIAEYVNGNDFAKGIQKIADKLEVVQRGAEAFFGKTSKFLTLEDWKKIADAPYVDMLKEKLVNAASEADEGFKEMYDSYGSFEESLQSGWLTKDIFEKGIGDLKEMSESLDEVGVSAEDAAAYLEAMWGYAYEVERGDWGNGIERFNRLTEAGLSYHDIQGLVNHDLLGWDYTLEGLNTTLRESGKYTDEQIAAIEAFAAELEDGGSSLNEFLTIFDSVDKMSNFELALGTLGNVAEFLREIFVDISTAFAQVFSSKNSGELATFGDAMHYWLERVYLWSEGLRGFGSNGHVVYTVAKNLFTAVKTFGTAAVKVLGGLKDAGAILLDMLSPLLPIFEYLIGKFVEFTGTAEKAEGNLSWLDSAISLVKGALEGLSKVLKPILEDFAAWVQNSDVVGKAFDALASAVSWAKPKVKNAISTLKGEFDKFWPSIRESLNKVPGIIQAAFEKISGFLSKFSGGETVSLNFSDGGGLAAIGESFGAVVDSLSEGKSKLEAFADFIGEIFTNALEAITTFLEGLLGVKTEFSSTASTISSDAEDTANRVHDVVDRITESGNSLSGVFGEGSVIGSFISGLQTIIGNIWQTLQNVSEIFKEVSGMSFDQLFQYFVQGTAVVTMFKYVSAFKSLADAVKGFTDIVTGFQEGSDVVSSGITNIVKSIRPTKFFEIALAIMGLAASLWLLSTIPADDLSRSVTTLLKLAGAVAVITGIMAALGHFMSPTSAASLDALALSVLAISGSILILSFAAKNMQGVSVDSIRYLVDLMLVLAVSAALVGKYVGGIAAGAVSMLAMAFSVKMLVSALKTLNDMNASEMGTEFGMLLAIIAAMAVALAAIGSANPAGAAVAVLAFAAAIWLLLGAIVVLGTMINTMNNFGTAAAALAVILIGFVVVMLLVAAGLAACPEAAAALVAFGVACLAVAASVLIIVAALWLLSNLNFENMIQGLVKLYQALQGMELGAFVKDLLLVAVGLAAVGIGLALVGVGIVLIGAGLVVVGLGLAILVAIGPVAAGVLVTIGGSMPAFGEGCVAAGKGLLVLGAGLLVAGAGAIVAAAGVGLLAAALLLFAVAMAAVMYGLPTLGQGIGSGLISGIASGGASALPGAMSFFKGAGNGILSSLSGPLSGGKASGLGKGLFSSFQRNAESESSGALNVVDVFKSSMLGKLNGLDFKSVTSQKGLEIPTGLTEGIESGSPEMMASVEQLFGDDLQGYLGDSDFSAMMEQMGYEGDMSFVEGLGDGSGDISEYLEGDFYNQLMGGMDSSKLPSLFSDFGTKAIGGFTEGLKNAVAAVGPALQGIADTVENGLSVDFTSEGQESATTYAGGVNSMIGTVREVVSQIPADQKAQFTKAAVEAAVLGGNGIKGYASSISAKAGVARSAASGVASAGVSALASAVGSFGSKGSSSGGSYVSGVRGHSGSAYSAGSSIASSGRSGVGSVSFYGAGVSAVEGFINGMQSRNWRARAVASQIGSGAISALMAALNSASPSKETYKVGTWFVEGFANGMSETRNLSDYAAEDIGKSAVSTLQHVHEAIENDFDFGEDFNPVIAPIVDLDNVKSASSMVDSMFANSYGLGLGSTLGAYNLYGGQGVSDSKSTVYNISVALQYEAGTDANLMVNEIASGLRSKLDLEG